VVNPFEKHEFAQFQVNLQLENPEQNSLLRGFHLKSEHVISSKRATSMVLDVIYYPMVMQTQRCFLIFCDPQVGEFQIEIIGEPEYPRPISDPLQHQFVVDEPELLELTVQPVNSHFMRGLSGLEAIVY
jgi:hypothetical protein